MSTLSLHDALPILIIPAGVATADILVRPINDTLMEGNETVVVTLSGRPTYTLGSPSSATVTIVSDEVVTISAPDPTATEAGLTTGEIGRASSRGSAGTLTICGAWTGTGRTVPDYTALPGSVMMPSGVATAHILVRPINDTLMEGNETVVVTLSGRPTYTLGSPSSATVTIVSDEVVTISAPDPTATEAGLTTG